MATVVCGKGAVTPPAAVVRTLEFADTVELFSALLPEGTQEGGCFLREMSKQHFRADTFSAAPALRKCVALSHVAKVLPWLLQVPAKCAVTRVL